MRNLQKGPDGLLGALDLKTLGQNPTEFPATLQGVLECTPYYLLRNRIVTVGSGAFVTVNTLIAGITTPNDEVWRVLAINGTSSRNVADVALTIEQYVTLRRMSGAVGGAIWTAQYGPVAATDLLQFRGEVLPEPLWMGPGDQLRMHVGTTITAAATSFTVSIDYERMPSG